MPEIKPALSLSLPPLLTSREVIAVQSISKRTLWRWVNTGRMPPPVRIGRVVRWRRDEIEAWIKAGCPPVSKFKP